MSDYATPNAPSVAPAPQLRAAPFRAAAVGFALGAAVVGAAWGIASNSGAGARQSFTLSGTMTIQGGSVDTEGAGAGQPCKGINSDMGINAGTSVTVYDGSGNIVGEGTLGAGVESVTGNCVFPVTVPGVTAGVSFYQVEVGDRGKVTLTAAEARAGALAATIT